MFLLKYYCVALITVIRSLWKSDRPITKVKQLSKHSKLLVRNKSIKDKLLKFLKQINF